jgi:hypothetical protein
LVEKINDLDIWSPENIYDEFRTIVKGFERWSPWDEFLDGMKIHIGKRSSGWKFLWNFQDNKFYTNKEELFKFIRSGRVVDEYGELQDTEEFIKMALEWSYPDGYVLDENYVLEQTKKPNYRPSFVNLSDYYDKEIDYAEIFFKKCENYGEDVGNGVVVFKSEDDDDVVDMGRSAGRLSQKGNIQEYMRELLHMMKGFGVAAKVGHTSFAA